SNGSPPLTTNHPSDVPCPLPRRIERVRVSIAATLMQPSPNGRRVGIRIVTFEACSGFTRVTARRIAQPPKVTFVTRLQSHQLPSKTARQLPDLSTIIRVEPSSSGDSRLQGALPTADVSSCSKQRVQRLGLLDHLVVAGKQSGWQFDAEGLRRFHVDDELEAPQRLRADDRYFQPSSVRREACAMASEPGSPLLNKCAGSSTRHRTPSGASIRSTVPPNS